MPRYNPSVIEPKWQKFWEENRTFACPVLPKGRKLYVLDMFPYPSGEGLHVGHPEGYTATDIVCRFQRMRGTTVMHPMGWDAFGLPAEQHAKKTGTHPRTTTEKNIANFRRQLKMLGFSYDWGRELATTDIDYFRWTQFIFLVLFDTWFDPAAQRGRPIAELPIPDDVAEEGEEAVERFRDEHRLAYQLDAPVNWCPALGTVLANEEVQQGVSERGGHPVVRIALRQWMLRITAYADRLERDLDGLDWSEGIKILQRNWIGRSTGAEVDLFIGTIVEKDWIVNATFHGRSKVDSVNVTTAEKGRKPSQREYQGWLADRKLGGWPRKADEQVLRIYTTRLDTLFGATYMVIAPEHPFVERLSTPEQADAVRAYCQKAASKSDLDRTDLAKEKTGVFTGSYAINPVNGCAIPIWVADYVLISYGTGAIMAVPAHDTRDFEFAKQFDLPIITVVDPGEDSPRPLGEGQGVRASSARDDLYAGRIAFLADGTAVNSGPYNGLTTAEFKKKITEDLAEQGYRPQRGQLQAPRLALQPAAFLGRAVPDSARARFRRQPDRPDPRPHAVRPAGRPAAADVVRREARRADPAAGEGPVELALRDARRPTIQARDEHDAAMGRLVLVLSAIPRPEERRRPGRSEDREGVDAGRSVRRRGGARGAAPALRPLLAQSALRSRLRQRHRAVPEAGEPGHDSRRQ